MRAMSRRAVVNQHGGSEVSSIGRQSRETMGSLMHDINDALNVAVGNLDLALQASTSEGFDRECLEEALRSCLEVANYIARLRGELRTQAYASQTTRRVSSPTSSPTEH